MAEGGCNAEMAGVGEAARRGCPDECAWQKMDVRDMSEIPDGSFDYAIDKGTMDSLLVPLKPHPIHRDPGDKWRYPPPAPPSLSLSVLAMPLCLLLLRVCAVTVNAHLTSASVQCGSNSTQNVYKYLTEVSPSRHCPGSSRG